MDPHNNIAINPTMAQDNIEPNNYRQPELITRGGMHERSVLEDAVVRNSWGKSRCELMCRFPNTGGLHRTSGGAPLEAPTLRDPELITGGMGGGKWMLCSSSIVPSFQGSTWFQMQAAESWHFSAGSIVPPGPTIVHLVTPADGQALTASVTISAFVGKMHLDKV